MAEIPAATPPASPPGSSPRTIGPYAIERELGRGGMGVVHLARDSRLDRSVAIKALPEDLVGDAAALSRFQREAKVLASLNHPNIASIYGLEEAGGRRYLVLEFVEGLSLSERLERGALPVDEALAICAHIAAAIEAAHEAGVIHRDLKPGNVIVGEEAGGGKVKVLDFGLAREIVKSGSRTDLANLVTAPRSAPAVTQAGSVMGTPGYMSPEQCRGKALDKRTDIWSLGCVLYESLTGVRAFSGETPSDAIAAILEREPDWTRLPARTPIRVRELLKHCLEKDPRRRLRDAGDAKLELEQAIAGREWSTTGMLAAAGGGISSWKRTARVVAGSLVLLGLGAGAAWFVLKQRMSGVAGQVFHVSASVPTKPGFGGLVGVSPDARFLVFTAWPDLPPESDKPPGVLMVRRLDRDETKAIDGTEGVRSAALSADGRWIAFSAAKDRAGTKVSMKKVGLSGGQPTGAPVSLCELTPQWPNLCWASDREIVVGAFVGSGASMLAISAEGGEPRVVLRDEGKKNIEGWGTVRPLPGGRSVLATRGEVVDAAFKQNVEVVDLATGKRTLVLANAGSAQYLPGGFLVALRNGNTLVAARFDPDKLELIGAPVTVLSAGTINESGPSVLPFDVSQSGTLAYVSQPAGSAGRRLAWVDDQGQASPIPGNARAFESFTVSPDGGRVLSVVSEPGQAEFPQELWVHDLGRRTVSRLPTQGAPLAGGVWSNDGQRIVYGVLGTEESAIWERRADGAGDAVKLYTASGARKFNAVAAWSPDGNALAFSPWDIGAQQQDLWLLERGAGSQGWAARPYLDSKANEGPLAFSPDGKWVYYCSSESGRRELYVQRFSGKGSGAEDARAGRVQVSTAGCGTNFWWGGDGKEIRYIDTDSQVMGVQVKTEPEFSASLPKLKYSIKDLKTNGQVFAPDGRLMVTLQGEGEQITKIDLVVNFFEELRAKMAAAN